jgi:plasmid stabilization system protein ParE
MPFEVIVTPSAKADIFETNAWLLEKNPETARKWLWQLSKAITSLGEFPTRCAVTEESAVFEVEVRQLIFGSRPNVFRVLFSINSDKGFILRVRSTRQRRLVEDIDDTE